MTSDSYRNVVKKFKNSVVNIENDLFELLSQIPDPEIPVINIVELGIVREAKMVSENEAEIIITPTYSA